MKTKLIILTLLLECSMLLQAQWSTDSTQSTGIFGYAGASGSKLVFSNGTEWNVFDANTGAHTYGNFAVGRSMIQVVSGEGKVLFAGGKFGYFADPQYTKNVNVYNSVSDTWYTWNLATAREVGGAASIGGKAVFAGGTGRSDIAGPVNMYNKVDIFDLATGMRTSAKLSKARSNIASAAAGNKIVFAGGWYWDMMYNVLPANTVDIYDVTTGIWTKTTLSKKRDNITPAVIGDKLLFAGGFSNTGAVTNVDIYNTTTNTWSVTYLPVADYSMKSATIGSEAFYMAGTQGTPGNIYRYQSTTGVWTILNMPTALTNTSICTVDGRLVLAGGTYPGTNTYSNLVQIFDPISNTWMTTSLSLARTQVTALSYNNIAYFTGGIVSYGYPTPVTTRRVDIYSAPFKSAENTILNQTDWRFQLYPNPATMVVHLQFEENATLPAHIFITDQNGKQMYESAITDYHQAIDIHSIPAGIYYVTCIDDNNKKVTHKLIKQ